MEEKLSVKVMHRGALRVFNVRDVVVRDEERIERLFPAPRVPYIKNEENNRRVGDFTDQAYLEQCQAVERDRKIGRIAIALVGDDPISAEWLGGETDLAARVERLKDRLKPWQVEAFSRSLLDPKEVTEPDVQREIEAIVPTTATGE